MAESLAAMRHRMVIGRLLVDPSESLYKAMRAVGYAHNTAIAPGKNLVSQPGFQQMLEEYLPDSMLLNALHEDIENKPGKRSKEIELAFKVKGKLQLQEQPPASNTYNTFIQQNNINPNTPDARALVDNTLDMLMSQTKRNE